MRFTLISRLVRTVSVHHNVRTNKEATMKQSLTSLATILVALTCNTAWAQPAEPSAPPATPPAPTGTDTATPAPPAATPSLFHFNTMSEAIKAKPLMIDIMVGLGIDWAKTLEEGSIFYFIDKHVDAKKNPKANAALKVDLGGEDGVQTGVVDQLRYISAERHNRSPYDTWLGSIDCKLVSEDAETGVKTFTPACHAKATAIADKIRAALPTTQAEPAVKAGIEYLLKEAMGDGTAATGLQGDTKIAALTLAALMFPFTEWPQHFGLTNDLTTAFVGQEGCFLYEDGSKHCGTIKAISDRGVTIDGEDGSKTEPLDKIGKDREVAFLVGDPSKIGDLQSLVGKHGCFMVGEEEKCLPITAVSADGVTLDGSSLDPSSLTRLTTFAEEHRLETGLRFVMRMGSAKGHHDFQSEWGVMAYGRVNATDHIMPHFALGVGSMTGTSDQGVMEGDSSTMFMAMAGVRFLLGSREWPVAPIGEANLTWQGLRPGVEAGLGLTTNFGSNLSEGGPSLSVLGHAGYYPTGLTPQTHPDFEVPEFNLAGGGFSAEFGWIW